MPVEPRFLRFATIVFLTPARQCNHNDVFAPRLLAHAPAHFMPVQPRQTDVEQHHLRTVLLNRFNCFKTIMGHVSVVARDLHQHSKRISRVVIVVNDKTRRCCCDSDATSGPWCAATSSRLRTGRRTINSLPCPSPALRASIDPPCISVKRFTNVSPIPSPPCECSDVRSTCMNISKILSNLSCGIPAPLSFTVTSTSSPSRFALSETVPPALVYLQLLLSKLPNNCASRARSASR